MKRCRRSHMVESSPRLWPYTPTNSPRPLPQGSIFYSSKGICEIIAPEMPDSETISLEQLRDYIANHVFEDGSKLSEKIDLTKRRPLLISGELANPYRLSDINASDMPIIPVRLENICRTWADNLDARDVQPGVHHVTLARSPGWWEVTYLTLLELPEMKRLVQWLDGPHANTWLPKRLAEGNIRLESDMEIGNPTLEEISWDGVTEKVTVEMPASNGPTLDLSSIMVPINSRQGCYNSRGRIIRCTHYPQSKFHEDLFRRGSSFKWGDLLSYL